LKVSFVRFSSLVRELRPYLFNSVLSQIRALEAPLVTVGSGQAAAAGYSLGVRLLSPLMMLYGSSGVAVLGAGASLKRRELRNLTLLSIALALSFICSISLSSILHNFAVSLVPWLSQTDIIVICVLVGILSMNLIAQNNVRSVAKFNAIFVALTLLTSLVLPIAGLSIIQTSLVSMAISIIHLIVLFTFNEKLRDK
jgi:hypothetical protein